MANGNKISTQDVDYSDSTGWSATNFLRGDGTWAAVAPTPVPATQGGTGQTSYAVGDMLYANTTTTLAKLADVAAGSYLRSGGVNTAPVWSTVTFPNTVPVGGILYATSTNVVNVFSGFTYDGSQLSVIAGMIEATRTEDSDTQMPAISLARTRSSSTQPGANFGVNLRFYLEGSVNNTMVTAAGINGFWETAQTNATTQRNSGMIITTMLANTLAERWRVASTGALSNTGAIGTAYIELKAGGSAASTAPLKLNAGTNLATAETGAVEYNGTNLFFTRTGTTRQTVLTANVVTTEAVVSDTTITVNIAGTNYKLLALA